MTSHFIDQHAKRASSSKEAAQKEQVNGCVFCAIVRGEASAFKVYEDDHCMAFLDLLPIREGHTLLIPKDHVARISQMSPEQAATIGHAMPKLSRALCKAIDQPDFNVVSNNGYAQVVHHVHFHFVPAPKFNEPKRTRYSQFDSRYELDPADGEEIAARIRTAVTELDQIEQSVNQNSDKAKM